MSSDCNSSNNNNSNGISKFSYNDKKVLINDISDLMTDTNHLNNIVTIINNNYKNANNTINNDDDNNDENVDIDIEEFDDHTLTLLKSYVLSNKSSSTTTTTTTTTSPSPSSTTTTTKRTLTDEEKQRIEMNKAKAMEIKKRKTSNDNSNKNDKDNNDNAIVCQCINDEGIKCKNTNIDIFLHQHFNEIICFDCKDSITNSDSNLHNDYELISKTDAAEYLIPMDSINLLKFIEKKNPKNSGWSSMKLVLRKHVREKSYKRWGGDEGLKAELAKRGKQKFNKELQKTKNIFDLNNNNDSDNSNDDDKIKTKKSKTKRKTNKDFHL